jgi:tetratricopeptide (TPR) repeat protein
MKSRKRTTIVATSLLAVSMMGCILLLRHIDKTRTVPLVEDSLYITSPKIVKRASLGFDGLMACIYWTRAVQYFGHRHFLRSHSYNELAPLLTITTTLDPHMLPAYQFGASFLAPSPPNGAGQPDRAIQLMEYGIAENPNEWRLYYDLGFVYYTELKNYSKAAEVFDRGSRVPNAHPFLKVLAAQMAEHAEDFATARLLWTAAYEAGYSPEIRQNALEHLRAIKVDEDVTNLQIAVTHFTQSLGRLPTSLWEVAAEENLPGIPIDPDGNPYELSVDGQVLVAEPDNFPFIKRGLPPGYKPGPPKFHSHPNDVPVS